MLLPLSVDTVYMVIGLLVIIKPYFVLNTSAWCPFHSNPDQIVTVLHPVCLAFMWGRKMKIAETLFINTLQGKNSPHFK